MRFAFFLVFIPGIVISLQGPKDVEMRQDPKDPDWLNYCNRKEIFENKMGDRSCDRQANLGYCPQMVKGACCKSCRRVRDEKNPLWKPLCHDRGIFEDVWKGCDDTFTSPCITVYSIKHCCGYCQRDQEFMIKRNEYGEIIP